MRLREYLLLAAFIAVFLLTRLPGLKNDIVNTDAPLWHERSEAFVTALKTGDFSRTYQKYHPGVTFEATRFLADGSLDIIRKFYNFEIYHYSAKLFVVFAQLTLSLAAVYFLSRILDFKKALLIMSLLSLEPFFVANSRLLHLDSLFTLFLFNGLLLAFLMFKEFSVWRALFAGFFLAGAFLTKSVGALAPAFVVLFGLFFAYRGNFRLALKNLGIFSAAFFLFVFAFFPALWAAPVETLSAMIPQSREVAFEKGHSQLFFGEETDNPGPLFYPFVLLLRLSPVFLLAPVIFYLGKNQERTSLKSFLAFLGSFYLIYLIFMVLAPKKIDRYMLPIFPLFAIWAGLVIPQIWKKSAALLVVALLAFQFFPLLSLYPHYFAYTSPLVLSAENANKIIGHKSFGTGVFELRDRLAERYPHQLVASSDVGPLKEIYGSFRTFEIEQTNPKYYELLILGPNVEMPQIVGVTGRVFKQVDSVEIAGIEFWRIFR